MNSRNGRCLDDRCYGDARLSGLVAAQVAALRKQARAKCFREVASGPETDRAQLRRLLD